MNKINMLKKHIEKIKKIVDDVYSILVFMGFLALICYLPNEIANFFGIEFFRGNIALMLIIIVGFVLFRIYINDLYETKKIHEKYYGKNQNVTTNTNSVKNSTYENMSLQEKYNYLSNLVIQGGNFADIDEAIEQSIKQYELDISSIDLSNKQEALSKIIMTQVQKDIDGTIALAKEQYGV